VDAVRTLPRADGTRLTYRVWRPGAPRRLLVLLHGLASNLTRWSEFVAATRLRDGWDILRLDLRGHAGSLDRGRLGMDEWCADLAAVLAEETQPRRFSLRPPVILVGHCLGANIAAEFACRRPGAVAGLVLIEPVFAEALRGGLRLAAAVRPIIVPVVWLVRALNALGLHRERTRPLDLQALDRTTRAALAAGADEALLAGYASPWTDLASTPTAAYLQALVALGRGVPDLSGLPVPVLALLSTGGAFGDPAVTERQLGRLPRGRTLRLEARHWIPTEQPEEMRRAIEAWCREVAGP
jgi:pimeloyl-ACP methyl ester carboxylesterase